MTQKYGDGMRIYMGDADQDGDIGDKSKWK